LPQWGGSFVRFAEFLDPEHREGFDDPERLRNLRAPHAGRARVHASAAEWDRLLARLFAANMLRFVDPDDVPAGNYGERVAAGFFSVPKSADTDRTICNRIPRNQLERLIGLAGDSLGHGAVWVELQLPRDKVMVFNLDDLADCYHAIPTPPKRTLTNAVGQVLSAERLSAVVELARGYATPERWQLLREHLPRPGGRRQPALCTLPMGDVNAVDYVQLVHAKVLEGAGTMRDDERLAYRRPFPRGPTYEGIVIDDHLWAAAVDPRSLEDPAVAAGDRAFQRTLEVGRASVQAYAEAGVARKETKAVRTATKIDAWGATVDGVSGLASAKEEIVARALDLTVGILSARAATAALLEAVLGLWTHALLFRRSLFCILGEAYAEVRRVREGPAGDVRRVFRLSEGALDELLSLVIFAAFMHTDTRAPVSGTVSAVDASSVSAAVGRGALPPRLTSELWRHRLRKAGYVRVASDAEAFCQECLASESVMDQAAALMTRAFLGRPVGTLGQAAVTARERGRSELWGDLAESVRFRVTARFPCRVEEHINVKEGRSVGRAISDLANDPAEHGRRQLIFTDSRVNGTAWSKGRSSSRALNVLPRRQLGNVCFAGLQPGFLHVVSAKNPLDDPTRGRPLRAPKTRPPWAFPRGGECSSDRVWTAPALVALLAELDRPVLG